MKQNYAFTGAAGLGAVALGLLLTGCGGSNPIGATPAGVAPAGIAQQSLPGANTAGLASPDGFRRHHHHGGGGGGACAPNLLTQNFNGQAIAKGAWILFTSVVQFGGNQGGARVFMKDSTIRFTDGLHNYRINGPDMEFEYGTVNVRLRYSPGSKHTMGGWAMRAPLKSSGHDFIDDIAWKLPRALPGNIQNVTWSAKFYSRSAIQQMQWQWGGAVYTRFTDNYQRLGIKPLDDQHYPPYNNDPAGSPERYKGWVTQGATGGGGNNYTGVGGPNDNVTFCP